MQKHIVSSLIFFLWLSGLAWSAGSRPAYRIFDKDGNVATYEDLLEKASQSQVILFGELHNNPIAHWLQYELARDLHATVGQRLVLGAEMFESDNQLVLDEYLSGLITENNFRAEARLWRNYDTDYRPLVEFARENGLRFVATNIPRRYASRVNRTGFEGLHELHPDALRYIAPLPIPYDPELPGYRAMLMMEGLPAHTGQNFPKAQAIKDATMAHFILENLEENSVLLHLNGAYHSNNYEGIVWYLRQSGKQLPLTTISTVEQAQVETLEPGHHGLADFIIASPASMTKTY